MAASAVVEISGLVKSFKGHLGIGRKVAVAGLDLEVAPGRDFRPAGAERRRQDHHS